MATDELCNVPISIGGDGCEADTEVDEGGDYVLKDRQDGGGKNRGEADQRNMPFLTSHQKLLQINLKESTS